MATIVDMKHPNYSSLVEAWKKYRLTYEGGRPFVEEYLRQFSAREDTTDFSDRKEVTYCPAYAKVAVNSVKNAIYQRMADIARVDGPQTYQIAISGDDSLGVDRVGSSMNRFIGQEVLPEMLSMAKVGVFVDKPVLEGTTSKAETGDVRPYLYIYTAEDILNWVYDENNKLIKLVLRSHSFKIDEDFGLPTEEVDVFLYLTLENGVVTRTSYDDSGTEIESDSIEINEIPFVIFEINQSLLNDVSDYQIALMQLESSDIHYSMKSNFPFYTEQYSPNNEFFGNISASATSTTEGTEAQEQTSEGKFVKTGVNQGRRYVKGLDRPGFINPSAEPLLASMQKETVMKKDIDRLVGSNLESIASSSAESKSADNLGKEEGLSSIGQELETGERRVSYIWSLYEGTDDIAQIDYPTNYSLRTDADRREEAKELREEAEKIPSKEYQKVIAKRIINLTLNRGVTTDDLTKMYNEIDNSKQVFITAETIIDDHTAGFVSTATASEIRMYETGEAEKAKLDHAERLARISIAQSKTPIDGDARGVPDQGTGDTAVTEKDESQNADINKESQTKQVRGKEQ